MLPYHMRLLVLLVLALSQVSESGKPVIWPNQEEILIDEGDLLEITCNGTTPIKFIYPIDLKDRINTSTPNIIKTEENGIYKFVFQRPNTVFGDTGWYGCADYDIDIIPNVYDNPEVNWIYVYVKSSTHPFVEVDNYTHLDHAVVGTNTDIPCRTTSPELVPTLYGGNDEELKKPFDPRIGFTINNLAVKDSDWYKCLIEKDDILYMVNYVLFVHSKEILPEPIIDDDSVRHVTRGEDLLVNCTVHVDTSMRYIFNWTTPQQSNSRISTQYFRKNLDGYNHEVTCQLTILNVVDEDAGEYECFIKTLNDMKVAKRNITIYDPQIKYIELTPQHPSVHYQAEKDSTVQWVVYIEGYPKPHIQWFNMNGEEIKQNTKYIVNTTSRTTILKIMSLQTEDTGVYILEAKNEHVIVKLNFTLDVMAKPYSLLMDIEPYYIHNKNAEFLCKVLSFPPPNITWSFTKYPNYPSLQNSTIVHLTNVTQHAASDYNLNYISRVIMPIEMSGKITCEACNNLGCDASTEIIFVSDGVGAFGIIEPEDLVTIGDDIEFTCAASIYNYTDNFTWTDQNDMILAETERLQIIQHKTAFTYRSTVKIKSVRNSDAQDYICTGNYRSSNTFFSESATYKLVANDPVSPFFEESNMNKSKIKDVDVITDGHKTVVLKCFVKGMPKPTMTWYKDDTLLKESDQYFFKYDYQELNIKYLKQHDSGNICVAPLID